MYDKELTKNDLHGLSAIAKHCLHAQLKNNNKKTRKMLACVDAWTFSTYIYTTGLMITLRADRKVSTSLTAYVTYRPDSKQKARSMCSLFYPFIDVSVLELASLYTHSPLH